MALRDGLNVRDDLDSRMREYVENIRFLTGEISGKNSEIKSTQETLNDLKSEGLVTPELEETFSRALQEKTDEKKALEEKRETIKEAATQELDDAKREYDKAENEINTSGGRQAAEVLSSICERVIEIGEWGKEIQEAMDETDDEPPSASKRLVLRHVRYISIRHK